MKNYNELLKGAKSLLKDASHTQSGSGYHNSNIIIAAVIGLAAGAILGILLAPGRGSETRDTLSNSLKDLGSAARNKTKQGAGRLADMKDKAVDIVRSKVRTSEPVQEN